MDGPVIRLATPADSDALATLYRRAYAATEALGFPSNAASFTPDDVQRHIQERTVFVAFADDDPVGVVQVKPRPEWGMPELSRLAVAPEWQGAGLGDRLREYVEAYVRDEGHDHLRLRTFTDHPFLIDWYERRGYREIAVEAVTTRPYDAVVMEKVL